MTELVCFECGGLDMRMPQQRDRISAQLAHDFRIQPQGLGPNDSVQGSTLFAFAFHTTPRQ